MRTKFVGVYAMMPLIFITTNISSLFLKTLICLLLYINVHFSVASYLGDETVK